MSKYVTPFNSELETGLRSLCLLCAHSPYYLDLDQLLALDHLIVHTGDIPNGPESLHPKFPSRNGELLVRRGLLIKGILLMQSKGFISQEPSSSGIVYTATDFASVFLQSLKSRYTKQLIDRSEWVISNYKEFGPSMFEDVFNGSFDRWSNEFQFKKISITTVN